MVRPQQASISFAALQSIDSEKPFTGPLWQRYGPKERGFDPQKRSGERARL